MINSLITVLTNFARIYLIRRFIIAFLGDVKPDKKKEIMVSCVFFVISTGAYFMLHLTFVNAICSIVGISALVLLRTKSVKIYFLVTFSIYFTGLICDCVVVSLFVDYKEGKEFNQVFVIIENFFILMCELVTEKIVRHQRKESTIQNIPLILVPLSSVITVFILAEIDDKEAMLIVAVSLLIINFLVFYLYDIVVQTASAQYENELLQQQVQVYQNQINIIMQGEGKVKSLRHDMRHHMRELEFLIEKKGKEDALGYINDMKSFLQNPDEIVSSGNVEMDSLLNYMLQRAKRDLKTVTVSVTIPENILPAFDINMILGNLLENAIAAARQSEEKMLEVLICYKQGVMTIDIQNSFAGELRKDRNGFLTTKAEKERHGVGLNSVRQAVEKYNGLLKTETLENMFCVNVVMYLSQF